MKVDAGDGDSQLARYASFCRKKCKEYMVYYLTLLSWDAGAVQQKEDDLRMRPCFIAFQLKHGKDVKRGRFA